MYFSMPKAWIMRMQRIVSGTWFVTRAAEARVRSWEESIQRRYAMVSHIRSGVTTRSSSPSPTLRVKMTAMILTTLQASANMLTMPSSNRVCTVSTSPTKREAVAPASLFVKYPAGMRVSLRHMSPRSLWVIFWPNTVMSTAWAESKTPERAMNRKYSSARLTATPLPPVSRLIIFSSTSGGTRARTMSAAITAARPQVRAALSFTTPFSAVRRQENLLSLVKVRAPFRLGAVKPRVFPVLGYKRFVV